MPNVPISTNQSVYTVTATKNAAVSRDIICFEVLDYDSLTYVKVGDARKDVTCLICKKVTIVHRQTRIFSLNYATDQLFNSKYNWPSPQPVQTWGLMPASDNFDFSGTRTVEYILYLLVGNTKYTISLGTLVITVSGYDHRHGSNQELIEETSAGESSGPNYDIVGDRLYGVSVNCGAEAVIFSYNTEERSERSASSHVYFLSDSPLNVEDYNDFWKKKNRTVGVINYNGNYDIKTFPHADFPDDVVMGAGYGTNL
jgi:hypothetical protein